MRQTIRKEVEDEVTRRAHDVAPQGDRISMVLIRMDEIVTIVMAFRRKRKARK